MSSFHTRLFLIDGTALAYRSYFAFVRNPLMNSKGENTSAPFGFAGSLLKLMREEKPTHIAVAFDTGRPTFRHEQYAPYKATREKMPEEMRASLPRIQQLVEAMNLPIIQAEGFEADDVIGTLAHRASEQGIEVVIVAGDKDFMQLVSPRIRMLNPRGRGREMEWIDEEGVRARFGVKPAQVTDVLALAGDTSDNVPGVPGVGDKTATTLIQTYEDLEGVLAHAGEISRKRVRENLVEYADQARLSRVLVTIRADVPLELDLGTCRFEGFDQERLVALFRELEFSRFLEEISVPEEGTQTVYRMLGAEEVDRVVDQIRAQGYCAVDLETTSTDAMRAEIVGISLALSPGEGLYIPIAHVEGENVPFQFIRDRLVPLLEDESIGKYGQNVKYDTTILCRYGIQPRGFAFDTMIAGYLLDPSARQHNLDALALEHLDHRMIPISDLIGKGKTQKSFAEVPIPQATVYSGEDAEVVLRLREKLEPRLEALALMPLFRDIEMPLVDVLRDMEMAGVAVDVDFLRAMSAELDGELDRLVREIHDLAGEPLNVNSTQQVARILFEKLGLPARKKTKTGYSTDVGVLEDLARGHELPGKLLDYRQLAKLKSTYVDALPKMVHPETNRIHTSFNQTITATGRLSSSDPNLQNIPIRTDIGRKIRRAFITPDRDHVLLDADYSQIELRIMAHLSGDDTMIQSFQRSEDVHTQTAALMFGVLPEAVSPELRRRAKTINFGIIYGISPYGLARQLDISIEEARTFIEGYFVQYPGVRVYMDRMIDEAREKGYVTTMLGRRRYLSEIHSSNRQVREFAERTAINTPIQGSSADLIKGAMIRIHRRLRDEGLNTRMILQVHDELVFEVPGEEIDPARTLIVEEMEGALDLSVPIRVDVGLGDNWLDAH